jgi:predicted patatin/cPLA2 family phospholipase
MGIRHLLTGLSYFNMKFIFDEIPCRLVPFDEEAAYRNSAEFEVGVTSMETGRSVFFNKENMKRIGINAALVASSSIPLLSQPVKIEGRMYLDGGVADSVPVRYALSRFPKAVVILTRPRGYRKGAATMPALVRFLFRKYPAFAATLNSRNDSYNETLDFCEEMERQGRLFIFAPEEKYSIGRAEKDYGRRLAAYEHGYDMMNDLFGRMRDFLNA